MWGLTDNLNSIGQVIIDKDMILYILIGFYPKYESIIVNLTSRNDVFTLQEVQFYKENVKRWCFLSVKIDIRWRFLKASYIRLSSF